MFSAMRSDVRADGDALSDEPVDLLDQRLGVEHDAIADDGELPAHDAGGKKRHFVGRPVDDERVAGIVAALEAHHDIGLRGQPVDDLALALVSPLGTDDYHVRHGIPFPPDRAGKKAMPAAADDRLSSSDIG